MSAPTYKVERELNGQAMYLRVDGSEAKRLMREFLQILASVARIDRSVLTQELVDAGLATDAQAQALRITLSSRATALGFANWVWKQGEGTYHFILPAGRDYLADIQGASR